MQSFVRNNIRYRSAASKALEGYYNSKAFILNELIDPKNGFDQSAKETLLLMFNKHAEWLLYVENLLLNRGVVGKEEIKLVIENLSCAFKSIIQIINQHGDVFDQEFIRPWLRIHRQVEIAVYDSIAHSEGMTQIIAFPYITECLISYLNATLFELYELDCLLGSNQVKTKASKNSTNPDRVILFVDDVTARYREISGRVPEIERLAYYVETFIDQAKVDVEIRDYSTKRECSGDVCVALVEQLEQLPYVASATTVKRSRD